MFSHSTLQQLILQVGRHVYYLVMKIEVTDVKENDGNIMI